MHLNEIVNNFILFVLFVYKEAVITTKIDNVEKFDIVMWYQKFLKDNPVCLSFF